MYIMAKKVKKKNKKIFRKPIRRSVAKKVVQVKQMPLKNRSGLALRNLILFAVLALISYILYSITGSEKQIYRNTFYLSSMILGFIALAFLIVFLVVIFSREKVKSKR